MLQCKVCGKRLMVMANGNPTSEDIIIAQTHLLRCLALQTETLTGLVSIWPRSDVRWHVRWPQLRGDGGLGIEVAEFWCDQLGHYRSWESVGTNSMGFAYSFSPLVRQALRIRSNYQ